VLAALAEELRPPQWVKNLTCLAGVLFSGQLFQAQQTLRAGLAFAAFCAVSSAAYILNDYLDREGDRRNPRTARRPLASGALPVWVAGVAFGVLLALGAAAACLLGQACAVVLACYAALNVGYSCRLKQVVVADVMCIALGFVMRVLAGVYAVGARPTAWIVLCMFFLALFLGFGKRKAELGAHGVQSPHIRPVLHKYTLGFLDLLLGMSATMTVLCYALFTVAGRDNPTLVVTILPVVYCVMRYLLLVVAHQRGESPDALLLADAPLGMGILCWVALCVAVLYGNLQLFSPHAA
jgi:4-hydroxybenzoate polyprenyltransferase